ncbi:MAG TPA: thiamine pyrophosphate-dependent enzyme, partial [Thermodesulfobacteriota bacterium]
MKAITPAAAPPINVAAFAPQAEVLLSAAQAAARGAVEAGVAVVVGYPGSPGSEAVEALVPLAGPEMRVEWAVNEKTAIEIAAGVAWSGKRVLVGMTMSGLNVAADSFLGVVASGVNGGLVILAADDPNAYYGGVEQDSRYYALMGAVPLLEPATPQETLDYTRDAFEVSERTGAPILLRLTTVLVHTTGVVTTRPPERTRVKGTFTPDPDRYARRGRARVRAQHAAALARLDEVSRMTDHLVRREAGTGRIGAIGVGVAWRYLLEARGRAAPDAPLLKLPASHPIPEGVVAEFLAGLDRVLVVEELEPVVERAVRGLAAGRPVAVVGKLPADGSAPLLPRVGDYDVDIVAAALEALAGSRAEAAPPVGPARSEGAAKANEDGAGDERVPVFPAGCPHRGTFLALRQAVKSLKAEPRGVMVAGDVGCAGLGALEPVSACATELAMGASIGVAQGFAYAGIGKPVVAVIGDGAFFHAGLPALVGAVHRQVDLTVLVLDNGTSCITGGQPVPGTPGQPGTRPIRIEDLARACQVRRVTVVDPYDVRRTAAAIVAGVRGGGVSVVIARRPCEAHLPEPPALPLEVRAKRCVGVADCEESCISVTACPAIQVDAQGKARIDAGACVGCRLCESVCPTRAIRRPWRFGSGGA